MKRNFPSDIVLGQLHQQARRRFVGMGFTSRMTSTSVGDLHNLVRQGASGKRVVLFVHGLGTSSNTWLRTIPALTDHRTFILLDLPGFGFSTVRSHDGFALFHDQRKALSEFVAALGGDPLTLVGHSFGGWLCAWYAATNPADVEHLVLVNGVGTYFHGIQRLRERFQLKDVSDTRNLLKTMWHRYPWFLKPFDSAIHRELMRRHTNELVASIEAEDLLVEELEHLRMPVSLIWGRNDGILSLEIVESILKLVPRGQVSFIEQCGHVPQLEKPRQFAMILDEVLRRVP